MVIQVQSPTRIDLSGGTLDCWPLFMLAGGSTTLNLSIDIFTSVTIDVKLSEEIEVEIDNYNFKKKFSSKKELLNSEAKELKLLKPFIKYFDPPSGFYIKTASQSPIGAGLGGSSSLCIGLVKAFCKWLNRSMGLDEMVRLASNIEAQVLETPTGTQDYYPAAQYGLNSIDYGCEGPKSNILDIPLEIFERNLTLVYTGAPHHSGINNWQVLKKAIEKDPVTMKALFEIKEIAEKMKKVLIDKDWKKLPGLFREEFDSRVKLSPAFSSPEIEKIKDLVLPELAEAVKICGAGGGGCVFIWSPKKQEVERVCQKNGFQILKVKPVDQRMMM